MTTARERLVEGYNSGLYNAGTNPLGLDGDGHRVNLIPAFQDVATVGQEVADNAAAAEVAAQTATSLAGTAITGTSTTSLTIGTDPVSLITQAGKAWVAGIRLRLGRAAAPNVDYMDVEVSGYDAGTGALTGTVAAVGGSGTHASWSLRALSVGTQAQTDARTATDVAVAPAHLSAGAELYGGSLTAAATLILPVVGTDFDVTGSTTIYAISSRTRGRRITLTFVDGLTLGHSSTLKMPDGIDMTVEAGGSLTLRALSAGWEVVTQKVRRASTSAHGLARLATQAVLDARTNSTDAVTAALLAHGLGLTGTSVTAAGTLTFPAVGDDFLVTGTGATITAMSARTPAGRTVRLKFAGVNTLVHAATFALFTGASIATEAGDIATFKSIASGWEMIGYERASGRPLASVEPSGRIVGAATANNSTSLDITTGINGTFDDYELRLSNLILPSNAELQLLFYVDGAWQTSGYSTSLRMSSGTNLVENDSRSSAAIAGGANPAYSNGNPFGGHVNLFGLSGSIKTGTTRVHTRASAPATFIGGFTYYGNASPVTGIRVRADSGSIVSGKIILEGKRSVV